MAEAQKRLDEAKKTEMPLENISRPVAAESFDSPKASCEDAKGSEAKPVGSPKSLHLGPNKNGSFNASSTTLFSNHHSSDVAVRPLYPIRRL